MILTHYKRIVFKERYNLHSHIRQGVAAQRLHNVLLIILCTCYLPLLYGALSQYPVPTLVDCSVGDVSPSPGAVRNQRLELIQCGNVTVTLATLLFLIYTHFYFTYWVHLFKISIAQLVQVATLYNRETFYLITVMIAAGLLYRVTCYKRRFVQGMTCMCDIWEE